MFLAQASGYHPHGFCYLWEPGLVWVHAVSDSLIAGAYYAIPFGILALLRRRHDVPFDWMFAAFAVFILACGTTHLMEVWTLWNPDYWASGAVKIVTAGASVVTAILLVPLVPKAASLPSPAELRKVNAMLRREVEERKRAEREQAEQGALLRSIVASLGEGVIVAGPDGRLVLANPVAREILGSELNGEGDAWLAVDVAYLPDGVRPYPPERFPLARALRGEPVNGDEVFLRRPDSPEGRWVRITGRPVVFPDGSRSGGVAVVSDITESKRRERDLARFESIVQSCEDGIVSISLDGTVRSWNPGAERLFGYAAEEMIGQSVTRLLPPGEDAEVEGITARIARGEALRSYETVRRRKDGYLVEVALTVSPVLDDAGRVTGAAAIARDISERKRMEGSLREMNRELEAFTYTASHDLRAPLRAMHGFADALLEDYGDRLDAEGRDFAERIVAAAGRMEDLIRDLLEYSRLTRTEPDLETAGLADVVEDARLRVQADIESSGGVLGVEGDLPAVIGDRDVLVQVLANLFTNAVKFVEPGVTPRVRVSGERRGRRVRVWVEDNGIGIASEHRDRIFRVFERLHGREAYAGTGIGLAVVQKGVERMGGTVGVEPGSDGGSRFWFELDAADGPS